MYAVIELNGTQLRVEKNGKITVNRIKNAKEKVITVEKVLFGKKGQSYFIGDPYVKGARVECEISGERRAKKVIAFKYRDRKSSQSKRGHRQHLTDLVVKDISFPEQADAKSGSKQEKQDKKKEKD